MSFYNKRKITLFFAIIGFAFLLGTFLQGANRFFSSKEISFLSPKDNFDKNLGKLKTIDSLIGFIDSVAIIKFDQDNFEISYAEVVDSLVRLRFYYGLQNYNFSENYLANLAGKYIWSHLAAKVDPNHILKGQKAFCSQSNIVFQEVLKRKGYNVRSVFLSVHYCTEVLIGENWRFFDVSFKPNFTDTPHFSTDELIKNPQILEEVYLFSFFNEPGKNLNNIFLTEEIKFGKVNEFAAPTMLLFHQITWFLSWFGWIPFLLIFSIQIRKSTHK